MSSAIFLLLPKLSKGRTKSLAQPLLWQDLFQVIPTASCEERLKYFVPISNKNHCKFYLCANEEQKLSLCWLSHLLSNTNSKDIKNTCLENMYTTHQQLRINKVAQPKNDQVAIVISSQLGTKFIFCQEGPQIKVFPKKPNSIYTVPMIMRSSTEHSRKFQYLIMI